MVSPTAPDKVQALLDATREMYDAFAKDGPTDTEMETAKKQMANKLDEQMREPGFWQNILASIDYRGRTLASVMDAPEAYQGFTAQQVKEAFNRYYKPERTFTLWVGPEAGGAPAPSPQPVPQSK
jgi:zinc protease